jgi:type IV pilus assembly protein PilB
MADRQRPRVGEILVRAGVIDEQQLKSALGEQTRWGGHLGSTLIKLGFVEENDLVRALASQLDLPMATLEGKRIPPEVLALVPREVADRERVMPLFVKREGGRVFLYVGVEDPGNLEAFDDLAFRTGMLIKPVMVAPSELYEAIDRCYHRSTAAEARPRSASVVTPGTEELARHWSQSAESSDTTSPIEKGVMTRGEFDERLRDLELAQQGGD